MRCAECKAKIYRHHNGYTHVSTLDYVNCSGVASRIPGCICTEESIECDTCHSAAQSAGRLPRKQEAACSIPATSSSTTYVCDECNQPIKESTVNSTGWAHIPGYSLSCIRSPKPKMEAKSVSYGFTKEQQQMMGAIVSSRLLFEDTKKKLTDIVSEQQKAEDKVKSIISERKSLEKSMILAEQNLIFSEKRLRESILQDVMIKGLPEAIEAPETKAEAHIEAENIGREA